ncbi:MAG: ERCC4 domain-containing protein [Candidatus Aenigmatarchaeota archaeon]
MQKTFSQKPLIICDYRERKIIEILKNFNDIKVVEEKLEVGDFLIEDIVIERKSVEDLINSVIDKRFFEQIENLKNQKALIIVEGIVTNEILGAIARIISENISIVFTLNENQTAELLRKIAIKKLEKANVIKTKIKKKGKTEKEKIISILISFPGISYKSAEIIMKKYSSIKDFVNSSKSKLTSLFGKRGENIYEILNKNFNELNE